jgi:hypothetical protein
MTVIQQSEYLPKQMNGPVVNAVMQSMEEQLEAADAIADYLYNLSITTAQETELENIGCIIGYPRPLVPEGFSAENVLLLTDLPHFQDISIGLSDVDSEVGGRLSTTRSSTTDYMDLELYRKFLDKVAFIKRYGITLYSVDSICSLISKDYTFEWDEYQDIHVYFNTNIGYKNVWILTQLFYRLTTSPQVIITSESGAST